MIALSQLAEGVAVQRVAGILGYDSVNAFITMFKKALGKSPTQYFSSLRRYFATDATRGCRAITKHRYWSIALG